MSHPFYRRLFPRVRLNPGGIGRLALTTTKGGGCRVVTVGGATTGFGADIIIIDDAMKPEDITSEAKRAELDRFYRQTLLTRLNSKRRGIIISIQQRLGEDDLPGKLLEAGAEHLCLPSYDDRERLYDIGFGRRYRRPAGEVLRPDEASMPVLEKMRRDMGGRDFATQYLQQPGALEGNVIPIARIPRVEQPAGLRELCYPVVQSWDTAVSEQPGAAFSVCLTVGFYNGHWHVLDVWRDRVGYAALRDKFLAQRARWRSDYILLEDHGSGSNLYHDLRYRAGVKPIMILPVADKETRMVGQLALIEDGFFALSADAPWLDVFLNELRMFPTSKYMDQIDALTQFLDWAKRWDRSIREPRDPVTGRKLFVQRRQSVDRRDFVNRR